MIALGYYTCSAFPENVHLQYAQLRMLQMHA